VQYLSGNACLGRQGTEAIGWRNKDDNWSEETRFVFVPEAKLEMMVMKMRKGSVLTEVGGSSMKVTEDHKHFWY
jgi:hypothetical protein